MTLESQAMASPGGVVEAERLREGLGAAVQALARCGITPATYQTLPPERRAEGVWVEAARAWSAAGVAVPEPLRVVLRCASAGCHDERSFASAEQALEAAILEIEENGSYPSCIEVEGRTLMDRAAILRAWEDRHDPG